MKRSFTWSGGARTVRGMLLVVVTAIGAATSNSTSVVAQQPSTREQAATLVREALHRKVYGLDEEAAKLLEQAAKVDPGYEAARWQCGLRRDRDNLWVPADASDAPQFAALARYRELRKTLANTVVDQLAAADWCRSQGLRDHERAHLLNVLEIKPDHEPTLVRLGYVPVPGGWESPEARAAQREREEAAAAATAKWQRQVAEIRDELNGHSRRHRRVAANRLFTITDADAIAVVDGAISRDSENNSLVVVEWLRQFDDPRAAEALAQHAVFSRWSEVRDQAKRALRQRPLEAFVPAMLATMRSPVAARVTAKPFRGGIDYDLELTRETQDSRQRQELNTIIPSATFAVDLQRDNARTLLVNRAVAETLCSLTDEDLPAEPQAWWSWWDRYNEVYVDGEKPLRDFSRSTQLARLNRVEGFEREQERITNERRAVEERRLAEERRRRDEQLPIWDSSASSDPNGNPLRRKDCLAAGTLVWTVDGPVAVETVQLGDLVLAQDVATGELAHKIVLRSTKRPTSILVKIVTANETFATSGGHPFWVVGRGWVKARQLQSGDLLHTLHGTSAVSAIEEGEKAETYNLIVDDFSSYFVGRSQVLTHDNTPRAAVVGIVPGMRDE